MKYVQILLIFICSCTVSPPKRLGHLVHVTNNISYCGENPPRTQLDPITKKQPNKELTCWVVLCAITPMSSNDLEKIYHASKEVAFVVCEH